MGRLLWSCDCARCGQIPSHLEDHLGSSMKRRRLRVAEVGVDPRSKTQDTCVFGYLYEHPRLAILCGSDRRKLKCLLRNQLSDNVFKIPPSPNPFLNLRSLPPIRLIFSAMILKASYVLFFWTLIRVPNYARGSPPPHSDLVHAPSGVASSNLLYGPSNSLPPSSGDTLVRLAKGLLIVPRELLTLFAAC